MDGPSPQPALKEAPLPGVLKKRRKSYNQRGGEVWVRSYPIYTQHCKHTRSILHVLQSGVCMSVCLSVSLRAGYQEPCLATPACPTLGTEPGTGMVPKFGGSQQAGPGPQPPLWLQRPVCVCTEVHRYVHGEPVCKYVQGVGSHHRGRRGCLRQGLPGVASSQVDSPQVSGRCDSVALRAELLGTLQGEQAGLRLCTRCHMFAHVST